MRKCECAACRIEHTRSFATIRMIVTVLILVAGWTNTDILIGQEMERSETSDRVALEALYHATDGPIWSSSANWLTDAPLGDWHGVDTDEEGRVVELDLRRNKLAGPVPPELGQLSSLRQLSLSDNQLMGSNPKSLLQLNWLRRFAFSNNVDLCAPRTAALVVRREVITTVVGPYCVASGNRPVEESDLRQWEGSWLDTSSSIGDNYYAILRIADVGVNGFRYSFECRDVPYGPNAQWSDNARATFRGPFDAEDQASGQRFSLMVDPDDGHARVIRAGPHSYVIGERCSGGSGDFVFGARPTKRASIAIRPPRR